MIKLDIISDSICPWCYIGKAHLDRAMEAAPDHPFTVEWHPFQLNPTMPEGGMDRREYLEHKFGGKEGAVLEIAQGAEMDRDMVARLLATDQDVADIRARDANARERGVTGVPCHIVANQHVLPGAQQPDLWAKVIEELNAQLAET